MTQFTQNEIDLMLAALNRCDETTDVISLRSKLDEAFTTATLPTLPQHPANICKPMHQHGMLVMLDKHNYVVTVQRAMSAGTPVIAVDFQRLSEIYNVDKLRHNQGWMEATERANGMIYIEIVGIFERKIDAIKYASDVRSLLRPATSQFTTMRRRKVRRVDTGQTWNSAKEAAEAHNISTGAMSSHLNRRKSYATVHGLVFEWAEAERVQRYAPPVTQNAAAPPKLEQLTNGAWLEDIGSAGVRIVTAEGSILPFDTRQQAMEHWQVFGNG